MDEYPNIQTVDEALACLKRHFMESDGLLASIEEGHQINKNDERMIENAFEILQHAWHEQSVVPKDAVLLLYQISNMMPELEQSQLRYPHHASAIEHFMEQLTIWLDSVFYQPSSTLSEEVAIASVCQHLLGTPQFNAGLIFGRIDKNALEELLESLEILAQSWQHKREIPKLPAYALAGVPWLFGRQTSLFSGARQQQFQEVEKQMNEAVTKCLS